MKRNFKKLTSFLLVIVMAISLAFSTVAENVALNDDGLVYAHICDDDHDHAYYENDILNSEENIVAFIIATATCPHKNFYQRPNFQVGSSESVHQVTDKDYCTITSQQYNVSDVCSQCGYSYGSYTIWTTPVHSMYHK